MSDTKIEIRNARTHNLKNVNVDIPHNKFITISGLSGSGKSSLAFDTLFAEGQRRYVESLSAYIRQFLGRMNKPEVDYINGLPPAIAIEQKVISNNPRSTVGTSTEIYEYLKLLFARIGKTVSPVSGSIVQRHNIKDVIDFIIGLPHDTEVYLLSPIILSEGRTIDEYLQVSQQQGFSRVFTDGTAVRINTFLEDKKAYEETPKLLIDRIKNDKRKETENRLADSVQVAFFEGHDTCLCQVRGVRQNDRYFARFGSTRQKFEHLSRCRIVLERRERQRMEAGSDTKRREMRFPHTQTILRTHRQTSKYALGRQPIFRRYQSIFRFRRKPTVQDTIPSDNGALQSSYSVSYV